MARTWKFAVKWMAVGRFITMSRRIRLRGRLRSGEGGQERGMMRRSYPTDLTDKQWEVLKPLIPDAKPGGHPRTVNIREVVNAILYLNRTGCQWAFLPHDLPPSGTVYWYFQQWRDDGTWEKIHDALRTQVRRTQGREPSPSAGVLDSQSVKTTEVGGARGYDAGKDVKGR